MAALKYAYDPSVDITKTLTNDRSFSRYIIQQIDTGNNQLIEDRYVISEFKRSYSDIQLLGYFLQHGAVPFWGSLESKGSLRTLFGQQVKRNLIRVQNLIESNFNTSSFVDRLIFQIDADDLLLLEPTPKDNITFIKELHEISEVLALTHPSLEKSISKSYQKMVIFRQALTYFIKDGKSVLLKNILKAVLEQLATMSKSPVNDALNYLSSHSPKKIFQYCKVSWRNLTIAYNVKLDLKKRTKANKTISPVIEKTPTTASTTIKKITSSKLTQKLEQKTKFKDKLKN